MWPSLIAGISLLLCASMTTAAIAQPGASTDFYSGKTITIVVGYPPAGGYAIYARVLSHHLGKSIPGNPNIIVQFMPGAGGTRAANFLYNVAPKDGTSIGALGQEVAHFQALGGSVHYDAAQFVPIGRMAAMNSAVVVWHTTRMRSIEEAMSREILFGTTGASSQSYTNVIMMRNLLGYKFRAVQGYTGGPEINLAMERGEVQARIGEWSAIKAQSGTQVKAGNLVALAEIGLRNSPDLKVPLVSTLAKTPEDREVIRFLAASAAVGRTFYLPPGVPTLQVEALRSAFDKTMKDPEFLEAAAKNQAEVEYMSGIEVAGVLRAIVSAKPDQIARANVALKD